MTIEELKAEIGTGIPENTCPDIDRCLDELNTYVKEVEYTMCSRRRYETPDDVINDLPSSFHLNYQTTLEKLREDNQRLRELGQFWYESCKSLLESKDI